MKHLTTQPVSAVCLLFGATLAALLCWICYRPEIQHALRTAQELLFWWQK